MVLYSFFFFVTEVVLCTVFCTHFNLNCCVRLAFRTFKKKEYSIVRQKEENHKETQIDQKNCNKIKRKGTAKRSLNKRKETKK